MLRMEHISDEIGMHWTGERDPASRTGRDEGIGSSRCGPRARVKLYSQHLGTNLQSVVPNPDEMHDAARYRMVRLGMAQSSKGYQEAYLEDGRLETWRRKKPNASFFTCRCTPVFTVKFPSIRSQNHFRKVH